MRTASQVESAGAAAGVPALPTRYEAGPAAGAGTFGTVWQVTDRWTGAVRAAKILGLPHRTPDWQERFYQEFALLYRLAHPSLVRAHDFGRTADGAPFFTMEWIEAPTLDLGNWNEADRLRILWELLDALAFLHREGIIHADIKTTNVKVDAKRLASALNPSGHRAVTLLDFGLTVDARVKGAEERRGTVHYMAPEWFGAGQVDFRIDYYSLGVLLFELWAGRPPFEGSEPLAVIRQHLEVVPPDLASLAREVPGQVAEGVARLLAKQPEIRDKGWELLKQFAAQRFGVEPGSGLPALECHRASLGTHREQIPDQVVDQWLRDPTRARTLLLRGGTGLDQHDVLRSIYPDVCRAGRIPWPVTDGSDPLPPGEWFERGGAELVPLLAVDPRDSGNALDFYRRWCAPGAGRTLALSVDADDGRNRELVSVLLDASRRDECVLHTVRGLDDDIAQRRMRQVLSRPLLEPERRPLLQLAAGSPGRLWALLQDRLAATPEGDGAGQADGEHWRRHLEREIENLERTWSVEERAAMSLLAAGRVAVDRSVLRALADVDWTRALGLWIDCGLVEGQAGSFSWTRPDVASALLEMLPERRRRIIHRAWAEYWGSRGPEVGTPEHEHLVYHVLRSDAYRQATRVGLEHARHCTAQHQAQRALDTLDLVVTAMAELQHPAPSLTFELAIAHAEARRVLGRYGEALEHLDAALRHEAIRGNTRWEAEIYKRKGDLCKSLKQSAAGKAALDSALERYRQLEDEVEVSHVLNNIGNIHYVAGEFDLALATYEEALALQRRLGLRREVASTLNNIGGLSVLRSRYDVAADYLKEAVEIKRTLDDPEELARSLNNLAVAHLETGKYGLAQSVLSESYRLNQEAGKSGELLFNLENLAGVALARGEWTEAMTHCEQGLKLCDRAGEPEGRLPFLIVMAGTALAQGNHDLIPAPLTEADRILQKIEDSDAHLNARLFEAEWALWLNQTDRALARATEVLARAEAEELPSWTTRGSIARARIAGQAGEHPAITRPWLEAALELAERTGALPEQIRAHALLAEVDVAETRIEEAADHLRRCEQLLLECSARPLFLPFSHALGHYYARRSEHEMALSALDTARKLAGGLTQLEWMWRFHALCGHELVAMKRFDGAVDQYRSGLVLLEHLASKVPPDDRERYMRGPEKLALAEGLRACHEVLVR